MVTDVLLDVTNIICKDIARDVVKEKRGRFAFLAPAFVCPFHFSSLYPSSDVL